MGERGDEEIDERWGRRRSRVKVMRREDKGEIGWKKRRNRRKKTRRRRKNEKAE